ncbi:MAG: amino acid permease [Planctomycetota bacterium]|nr:MAG: amino acid permease [Planctomycetota bacterium]
MPDEPAAPNSPEELDRRRAEIAAQDVQLLNSLGYSQELLRRMSGFSNFAISLSIICIVAGGITSFPLGLSSVGGASIGLGWPLSCLMSLCVALAMAQIASAFPTAGGLYHWAAILGGRGWGWLTAWFNLAGLITVLAAINVGCYEFAMRALSPAFSVGIDDWDPSTRLTAQLVGVLAITCTQALLNHLGIRITALLVDFSGYWILLVASILTVAMLVWATSYDAARLVTFTNYSGTAGGDVWPATGNLAWLFLLGFLLPAYTITGFDASAHTAEETIGASYHVPRGIVRSVAVSGIFGWVMLMAIVVAIPDMDEAAAEGDNSFHWIVEHVLPTGVWRVLAVGIVIAQFFCGLATVTSASRMAYAFARDGGLPLSARVRQVSRRFRTPAVAIWSVALLSVAFVVHSGTYSTITGACTIFLYISYVIPNFLGLFAYGRTWTTMGVWSMGGTLYRAMAVLSVIGCGLIVLIGVQPPNEQNLWTVPGALLLTAIVWFGYERKHFRGPPQGVLTRVQTALENEAPPRAPDADSGSPGLG